MPLTRDEAWDLLCRENPDFATDDGQTFLAMSPTILRKFADRFYDYGYDQGLRQGPRRSPEAYARPAHLRPRDTYQA